MSKTGLVLEGGAMRGVYTAGVLDYFMKQGLYFDYVIGISAGACQACSYISKQPGRNRRIFLRYVGDDRYLSVKNLLREGSIFGLDFIFGDIAETLDPFDYDTFLQNPQEFVIGATNCVTGETEYFYKSQSSMEKMFTACKASSSMPLVSREVVMDGKLYLDGGITDPIPLEKALEDGCDKIVAVLTRNRGYRKKPSKLNNRVMGAKYRQYGELREAMARRYERYNKQLYTIDKMEREGKIVVIRPLQTVVVGRTERNKKKLDAFYKEGFLDCKRKYSQIQAYLEKKERVL